VFHQSQCISAIKRIHSILSPPIYPHVLSCICVYLVTAMHVSLAPCVWEWRRCTIQ